MGIPCPPYVPSAPTDITQYFAYGVNTVEITLKDACGFKYGSSAIWLIPGYPQEQGWSPNECPFCGNQERQGYIGGPINTLSGDYTYQVTDLSIATGGQPLKFERTYNSKAADSPFYAQPEYNQPLGVGWTHNHDIRLLFYSSDLIGYQLKYPTGTIALKAPHGSLLTFYPDSAGNYAAAPGIQATMMRSVATPYVYTVTTSNQTTFVFDTNGRLTSQRDPAGQVLSYTYYVSATNPLRKVSDPTGQRYLEFFYQTTGLPNIYFLQQVRDPLGRHVDFTLPTCYGPCRLSNATDTRGLTWTYYYSGTSQYALTAILDPDGKTVERNEYDSSSRVARQWNGANELVASLARDPAGTSITLTDALSRTMVDNYSSGVWAGGSDAASQAITRTYNANFRPTFVADPNGNGPQMKWSDNGNNLERITDTMGFTTTVQYDGLNNPKQITDTRGFTTTYTYSGTFLTRQVDAFGNTWIYTPTNDGRNLLAAENRWSHHLLRI